MILFFSVIIANAQIVYTDVIPDSTSTGSYNLDLNNDGTTDFLIAHTTSGGACNHINDYLKISPQNGSKCSVKKRAADEVISSSLSYSAADEQTMVAYRWVRGPYGCVLNFDGNWDWAVDGYLALELVVSGNSYYGWARLNTNGAFSFTIKDYAFNSKPDSSILAGQTSCTIPSTLITASGNLAFCKGGSVELSADNSASQFQWSKDGAEISGATNNTYPADESGTYTCDVTNSCATIASDSVVVTVNKKPKATVTPSGIVNMCAGDTTNLLANTGNNLAYQWKKNGSNISGATNSTFDVTFAGDYKVKVTNTNTGCSKTSKETTVNITCKEGEIITEGSVSVFPNPIFGSANISFYLSRSQMVSLKIYDVTGRLIVSLADETIIEGNHQIQWNAENESSGVYFLKMQTENRSEAIRLSVVR